MGGNNRRSKDVESKIIIGVWEKWLNVEKDKRFIRKLLKEKNKNEVKVKVKIKFEKVFKGKKVIGFS